MRKPGMQEGWVSRSESNHRCTLIDTDRWKGETARDEVIQKSMVKCLVLGLVKTSVFAGAFHHDFTIVFLSAESPRRGAN
jgi:hypothetical protein